MNRTDIRVGQHGGLRTLDDEFAEVADSITGFGGFYFDKSGGLVIVLKNPELLAESRAALERILSIAQSKRLVKLPHRSPSFSQATAILGKYSFRELYDVYRGPFFAAIQEIPGLVMTDIDEVRNQLVLGVASARDSIGIREVLGKTGVPSAMLQIDVTAPPTPNSLLSDALRPIPGAARIKLYHQSTYTLWPCTLGYNMLQYPYTFEDPPAEVRFAITNSHCTEQQWSADGTDLWQGNAYVGTESVDLAGFTGAPCNFGKTCRYSDASLFVYYSASDSRDGEVAYPSAVGDTSFTSYKTVTWVDTPYSGMAVHKVGATSGRYSGNVTGTCSNFYGAFAGKGLLCQNTAQYYAEDGDSGGPVLTLYGDGSVSATGQHWGNCIPCSPATSYFSATYMILDEFYWRASLYLSPVLY